MVTLTIDNQTVTVPAGTTVLEAAQKLGIVVPHLCYHKELGAVGSCRMCAVMIHKGTLTGLKMSCLIAVEEGMVVTTTDERSMALREQVGEWLMLNHPHDCPVCDEGGECQLQEMTIAVGHGRRRYTGKKHTYPNQDLGPFIAQEMNRCIHCYRCARTYKDYCGGRDFGVMGSRNRVTFGRFADGMLQSDFSGNLIDFCPTGVFTDRTFRFTSRFWDLQEADSVCSHCGVGCAVIPGGRLHQLQRVRSGTNAAVNGSFLCDRGRFGFDYGRHPERPRRARRDGQEVAVDVALEALMSDARALIEAEGPEAVLLLGSERASLESNWLLQRLAKELGCRVPVLSPHARRHQAAQAVAFDLSHQLASLADVRTADVAVVFGVDPLAEAPLLALALRQIVRQGGRVVVCDPRPVELPFAFEHQPLSPLALHELLGGGDMDGKHLRDLLRQAKQPVLVAGADLLGTAGLRHVHSLAQRIATDDRACPIYPVLAGANSFGAALLSLPEQDDLMTRLEGDHVRMMICLETDPLVEGPDGKPLGERLARLEKLVVFDYLPTAVAARADTFIPTCPPVEASGTFINSEGRLRRFERVLAPGASLAHKEDGAHPPRAFFLTQPDSEPLPAPRLLQRLLGGETSLAQIQAEMVMDRPRLAALPQLKAGEEGERVAATVARALPEEKLPEQPAGTLQLVVSPARYGSDLLSRYARQLTPRLTTACVYLHPEDAERHGVQEGDRVDLDTRFGRFTLPLALSETLARGCALVENSAALPEPIPGSGISFCRIGRGGANG